MAFGYFCGTFGLKSEPGEKVRMAEKKLLSD